MLLQFSTDIVYTLNQLILLYKEKEFINYDLEIEKASIIFKEINSYCIKIENESNKNIGLIRTEKLNKIMDFRKINTYNIIEKLKEINKL